jgi:hypothetical protein
MSFNGLLITGAYAPIDQLSKQEEHARHLAGANALVHRHQGQLKTEFVTSRVGQRQGSYLEG